MTGWRLGAAVGPAEVVNHINRLNTNDEACTTHFIQWAGIHLTAPSAQDFLHNTLLPELKKRRDLVRKSLAHSFVRKRNANGNVLFSDCASP